MTDVTPPAATENVSRGTTFALAVIPISLVLFGVVGVLLGGIGGIVAVVVPTLAAWFYAKGAGAPLSRAGLGPVIGISVAGIVLGIAVGIIAAAYNAFSAVGGDGGLASPAFWTTVRNQLGSGDLLMPLVIGLGLGIVGIATVVRTARAASAPVAPPVADATAPTPPNSSSPGILLNGQPLDPDKK